MHSRRILLAALFALRIALPLAALPALDLPAACRQGDALVVRLRSALPLSEASLCLRMPDGKQGTPAQAFLRRLESGEYAAIAILPLPMYAPAGPASLLFSGREDQSTFFIGTTFDLRRREYAQMDIDLNPDLTSIKASPDPKKDEESRILTALLYASTPGADYLNGPFIRPIMEKAVTAAYGDNRRYLYSGGGSSRSIHTGLDLHQEAGTPIKACGRGRVVFAQSRIVTGNTVVIEHQSGLYSLYYHMESIAVKLDEIVDSGQIIGKVGSTGLSTGPHLHWELRLRAEALDPESLIAHPLLDKTLRIDRISSSYEGR
jgi:murein DD-endopeptidase MepM/ murein hydrolase activator NlpD